MGNARIRLPEDLLSYSHADVHGRCMTIPTHSAADLSHTSARVLRARTRRAANLANFGPASVAVHTTVHVVHFPSWEIL